MKWTLLSLVAAGGVTYALVFLVHAQYESEAVASTPIVTPEELLQADQDFSDPQAESFATIAQAEVSNPQNQEQPEVELFEGKPWPAGVKAFAEGDYETALTALELAVAEDETVAYRHYLLGLTYMKFGESEIAVTEFERSLELAPGNVRTLVNLSRAYLKEEDNAAARTSIDAALELQIDDADAWNVLGRIELAEGKLDDATVSFGRVVDLDPGHAHGWNNLGYARIQQGRYEEAVEPLQHAVASGLKVPYFYNNLGVALERSGDLRAASEAFVAACDLGSTVAEVSLGRVETFMIARGDDLEPLAEEDELGVAATTEVPIEEYARQK